MSTATTALPSLQIGEWTLPVPIIQGGMGVRVSAHKLASAVANEGGAGIVASVALSLASDYYKKATDYFRANKLALADELRWAREQSPLGIIGTNCMVAVRDFEAMVRTSVENGAQMIISGAGLPLRLPELASANPKTALVPIVSSLRAAQLIARRWWQHYKRLPDAIIFEDPNKAGGHLGVKRDELGGEQHGAEEVVPQLAAWARETYGDEIPIIAAGGIWDRFDIDRMFELGARGVQMATRFICTEECDADEQFKKAFLEATEEDTVIVDSPAGLPGRALSTELTQRLARGEEVYDHCDVVCLRRCGCRDGKSSSFCIAHALHAAQQGDMREGLVFTGSNALRAKTIVKVRDIFRELTGRVADWADELPLPDALRGRSEQAGTR